MKLQATKTKLNGWCYYIAQNSNFDEIGSYLMEKMSSGFPSDVLQLLCLSSVIHGDSWKQHVGCLQTDAAAAAALGSVGVSLHYQMEVQCLNGHQNQRRVDGRCNWTQQPLQTLCKYCKKRTLMKEKRQWASKRTGKHILCTAMLNKRLQTDRQT